MPSISQTASKAHILPNLSPNNSLFSLDQSADDGCIILLNKNYLQALNKIEQILTGFQNKTDDLWDIPMSSAPLTPPLNFPTFTPSLNLITPVAQPTKILIQYIHTALFSPAKSTLSKALHNNHFIVWLGLIRHNVAKFLTETTATAKGHLDQH